MWDKCKTVKRFFCGDKKYFYSDGTLTELAATLSADRFDTYLKATAGDKTQAMRLYAWNTAISAAFYGPLQSLEITLRNSMHHQLSAIYDADWYDNNTTGLKSKEKDTVARARKPKNKPPYTRPSDIIANLNFGFWVSLLIDDYKTTLWIPALRGAFPHAETLDQETAQNFLAELRDFRNRIAHHEPIFKFEIDLERNYQTILLVLDWVSPQKTAWVEAHSRVPELLALSPDDAFQF